VALTSLDYVQMRIGLDDLAYLTTQEEVLTELRVESGAAQAVVAAKAFFERLDSMIKVDREYCRRTGSDENRNWQVEKYNSLRNEIIELILDLPGIKPQALKEGRDELW
jgi:hypothetical protein